MQFYPQITIFHESVIKFTINRNIFLIRFTPGQGCCYWTRRTYHRNTRTQFLTVGSLGRKGQGFRGNLACSRLIRFETLFALHGYFSLFLLWRLRFYLSNWSICLNFGVHAFFYIRNTTIRNIDLHCPKP